MEFFAAREKKKILTILNYLISKGVEISVEIQGSDEQFSTKVVKLKKDDGRSTLIIEKLYPEPGNSLIQSSPDVLFSFELTGRECAFATKFIGINTEHPEFGLIVGFPSSIEIENKRRGERIENGLTKFLSVEFVVEGDTKVYHLKVIDVAATGLGLIVDKENLDLLKKVNVGASIKGISFFLPQATLTVDAEVKHMTRITRGESEGSYILGIESGFIMDLKELKERLKKEI